MLHVGVALRRRQGGVPQDLLDTAQVGPSAEHVGGSGVAQPVGAEVRDPGGSRRAVDDLTTPRQAEHSPQGWELTPFSQFRALARMRAMVVLPTPRVPVSR